MTRDEKGKFIKGHPGMGGRKPKSHEERLLKAVADSITPEDIGIIMDALKKKAKNGSIDAAKVILAYAIGMPIQRTDITSGGKVIKVVGFDTNQL